MRISHCLQFLLPACCSVVTVCAQNSDSLKNIRLEEVAVTGTILPKSVLAAQSSVFISADEMHQHVGHSLMDALSHTEGVQAMDIGVGFSKPMIRGLGFQRIAVTENGVKQEGQQWGADHGLEIDAFHVEGVRIVKGPASVLYGSDAMGGAIEILPTPIPRRDTIAGEALFSYASVCSGVSGSVMLQMKRNRVFSKIRYTERHWADYHVPADSFTYLSMRLPISGNQLKNTAGTEHSVNALLAYKRTSFENRINLSNSYQKSGFFSGAHGIPNIANLQDDGNRWNIDLPYSMVNHLKISSASIWSNSTLQTKLILGYQMNHREEWSRFHSHNPAQTPPAIDPDKELMLQLQTGNAQLQLRYTPSTSWEVYWGVAAMMQHNDIGGYGFLIPSYQRQECGVFSLANYHYSSNLVLNASVRYDLAHIHTQAHGNEVKAVRSDFDDFSLVLGMELTPSESQKLRFSIGRAFRLPSVNELTSNGVHHGVFRHEVGDSSLVGEQGWQVDLSYAISHHDWHLMLSPFYSYYPHFISLHPTGRWSMLPDAGQMYRFVDAPTTLAGGELHAEVRIWSNLHYAVAGEYVYTYNHHSHTATPFSPPASLRNTLRWEASGWQCFIECQSVAAQNRICQNEDKTKGYNLCHIGGNIDFRLHRSKLSLILNVHNLTNVSYLNHLNFYRRIELPEAGIDIRTTIRLNF